MNLRETLDFLLCGYGDRESEHCKKCLLRETNSCRRTEIYLSPHFENESYVKNGK